MPEITGRLLADLHPNGTVRFVFIAHTGGSHDPSRVEPPVVAMKKSIPGKTPKEAVSEKSGSSSGDNGFRELLEGRFGADDPLGENIVLGWTQMDVYF